LRRRERRRVLPHAELVVRAPDRDLGIDVVIKGLRKPAAAALEVGENAIPALGAERIETPFEEAVEVHPKQQLSRPIASVSRASGGVVATE